MSSIDWKKLVKEAKKVGGIEEIEVNSITGLVKVRFFKEDIEKTARKHYNKRGNKRSEEIIEKIKQQAEIDEMSILDPAAYEEKLASGELVEALDE
jgi:hypothetical protein